jgi:hypothetical protein
MTPGVSEMGSNERAEFAAEQAGKLFLLADRSARVQSLAHRVTLVPKLRALWISRPSRAGVYEVVGETQRELSEEVTVGRVEGMVAQADGSYTLDYPPEGDVRAPVRVHLTDRQGSRRILLIAPGEELPIIETPEEGQ